MISPQVVARYRKQMESLGLGEFVLDDRPWGGEFIYTDNEVPKFVEAFFSDINVDQQKLSTPKLLFVAPGKRFSWQYHERRGEIWRVLEGPVGVITSMDDEQPPAKIAQEGDVVRAVPQQRHRLAGQKGWGVVAELWVHEDLERPSTEDDNTRLDDDFGRN